MKSVDVLIFGTSVSEAWLNRDIVEATLTDKSIQYKVDYSRKQIVANICDAYECVFRFVSPKTHLDGLIVKGSYMSSNLLRDGSEKEIEHCIKTARSSYVKALNIVNEALEEKQNFLNAGIESDN